MFERLMLEGSWRVVWAWDLGGGGDLWGGMPGGLRSSDGISTSTSSSADGRALNSMQDPARDCGVRGDAAATVLHSPYE